MLITLKIICDHIKPLRTVGTLLGSDDAGRD